VAYSASWLLSPARGIWLPITVAEKRQHSKNSSRFLIARMRLLVWFWSHCVKHSVHLLPLTFCIEPSSKSSSAVIYARYTPLKLIRVSGNLESFSGPKVRNFPPSRKLNGQKWLMPHKFPLCPRIPVTMSFLNQGSAPRNCLKIVFNPAVNRMLCRTFQQSRDWVVVFDAIPNDSLITPPVSQIATTTITNCGVVNKDCGYSPLKLAEK
jgi:hypothetical protein